MRTVLHRQYSCARVVRVPAPMLRYCWQHSFLSPLSRHTFFSFTLWVTPPEYSTFTYAYACMPTCILTYGLVYARARMPKALKMAADTRVRQAWYCSRYCRMGNLAACWTHFILLIGGWPHFTYPALVVLTAERTLARWIKEKGLYVHIMISSSTLLYYILYIFYLHTPWSIYTFTSGGIYIYIYICAHICIYIFRLILLYIMCLHVCVRWLIIHTPLPHNMMQPMQRPRCIRRWHCRHACKHKVGKMTLNNPAANTWEVQSIRSKSNETSSLTVTLGSNVTLDAAYITLEAMIIYSCAAFPSTPAVTVADTSLLPAKQQQHGGEEKHVNSRTIPWKLIIKHTECNQSAAIDPKTNDIILSWSP